MLTLRDLYAKAASSKQANQKLVELLNNEKENQPLLIGYRGASVMIEANHVFNPITKLSRFKKGKELIEQAIQKDPNNVELKFVRLTIQTNLPSFLGYSSSIVNDKQFVIKSLATTKDVDLRSRIVDYLYTSRICTAEELKKITVWKNK